MTSLLRRRSFVASCAAACSLASPTWAQTPPDPAFTPPEAGSLIVLLPPEAEADELQAGLPLLLDALHRTLSSGGYRVALLDAANFATLWAQEAQAAGGLFDPVTGARRVEAHARAITTLSARVAGETGARLVIKPWLVLRTAELSGTKAVWDGQQRLVPARHQAGASAWYRGTTTALSVDLLALQASGALAFRSFGGASLPFVVNAARERLEVRENLFSTPDELHDGVSIALRPLRLDARRL
jgi:hypothetical protein